MSGNQAEGHVEGPAPSLLVLETEASKAEDFEALSSMLEGELRRRGVAVLGKSEEPLSREAILGRLDAGVLLGLVLVRKAAMERSAPPETDARGLHLTTLPLPEKGSGPSQLPEVPPRQVAGAKAEEPKQAPLTPGQSEGIAWKGAIEALGGFPAPCVAWEPPESLIRVDPIRNVLEAAGQRGVFRLPDGTLCGLFGYPDLARNSSKVLLVGSGEPWGRVIALHRYPRWVGLCTTGSTSPIPSSSDDVEAVSVSVTGKPAPRRADLFAIDGHAVYLVDGDRVWSWDGRRERDEGRARGLIASLLLQWSTR